VAPIVFEDLQSPLNRGTQTQFRKTSTPTINLSALFRQIRKEVRKKNYSAMYNLLNSVMNASGNKLHALFASRMALFCEIELIKKHPDSSQRSMARLISFFNNHYNSSSDQEVKSIFLKTLSEAYFSDQDIANAETKLNLLFGNYPATESAKQALWLKQLIAMAKRDTIGVDTTINQMIRAGYSNEDIRVAKAMRYAFLRVKPKNMISKRLFETESQSMMRRTSEQLLALTSIRNYPNPFGTATLSGNPSTMLEYYLPQESNIVLKVFSMLGKQIETIADGKQKSGRHFATFNAPYTMPAGMYFYVLSTEFGNVTGKMMYVK
jgi:hypothetical protein